ncbi:hypothetical protein BJY01DRAFT_262162 [Aspergillus pseudoustus]|uniref:Uncharacterized protein n=1 Tax=Aspergillus pseudoustus TaxID=1810923 RepID=A0ABR4IH72_9EURO
MSDPGNPGWQQVRRCSDHLGNPVVNPLFEIYLYTPTDAYDCIGHHRREIAYRTQQDFFGRNNPPPLLIPQFFEERYGITIWCCMLIRTHSYRLGYIEDGEEYAAAGEAPDWLYFTCTFSSTRGTVDPVQRLPSAKADPDNDDDELNQEAFELTIDHIRNQAEIGQQIMQQTFPNAAGFGDDQNTLHYAMDVEEGSPSDGTPSSETLIREQLDQRITDGGHTLHDRFGASHGVGGGVTVSDKPEGGRDGHPITTSSTPLFLSHTRDQATAPGLLDSTARFFTAALKSHLPNSKSFHLEFHIPQPSSTPWPASISAHRAGLATHGPNGFPIGTLQTIGANNNPPTLHRVSPARREDSLVTAKTTISRIYRIFAVILDRASFIIKAGAYFFIDHYNSLNNLVWRSAGIREVARWLEMVVIEEAG